MAIKSKISINKDVKADTPPDLEARFDELATRINADAIRYATGG
ncbi:MAG: hypothetical protein V7L26_18750 [Nostoc sp.]